MWQMIEPLHISQETYNEHLRYKFFIPVGFTVHNYPEIWVESRRRHFYSKGVRITDEV